MATAARAFATTMADADPAHAAYYRMRGAHLAGQLHRLDRDYARTLATCRVRTLVVSHDAFEYLGRRYHLDVVPIAGLEPDSEPSLQRLHDLSTLVRERHVTTVFFETLASPDLARSLAGDIGISTARPGSDRGAHLGGRARHLPLPDAPEPRRHRPRERVYDVTAPVLSLDRVGVVLGGRPIVRDVASRWIPGRSSRSCGANGSGKSTLVKALVGLNPVSHGSVTLFGTPIDRFAPLGAGRLRAPELAFAGGVPSTVREVVTSGRVARRRRSAADAGPIGPTVTAL